VTLKRTGDRISSKRRDAIHAPFAIEVSRVTSNGAGGGGLLRKLDAAAFVAMALVAGGCTSAPESADYASNNAKAVLSSQCPDVSGVYEGRVRQIVEGYGTGGALPFTDEIFHADDPEAAAAMRARYRRDANGFRIAPDTVAFRKNADGNYTITTYYDTSELGSFRTRFSDVVKVACEAGVISWATPEQSSRSEYGPNYSFSGRSVRVDSNGDILFTTWTHMSYHMTLLWLPMGAGTDKTVYRYRRLKPASDH
jgi:hypothetical protein